MNVYFAHPITDYGTEREVSAVNVIEGAGWQVENPNQPHHQAGYDAGGMQYFERLSAACDALVFMRFPDGSIGAGVGKEIDAARGAGKPIFELFGGRIHSVDGTPTPVLSVEDTRATIQRLRVI